MSQKVFLKVEGAVLDLPHASVGFARMERITSGWVVKSKNMTNYEGEQGMAEAIHRALETTQTVSGYKDGDIELWDVVEIFDNEEEATKAGKKNGQMSIYQIETGRLKWIW